MRKSAIESLVGSQQAFLRALGAPRPFSCEQPRMILTVSMSELFQSLYAARHRTRSNFKMALFDSLQKSGNSLYIEDGTEGNCFLI